jgi:hypothetical protein
MLQSFGSRNSERGAGEHNSNIINSLEKHIAYALNSKAQVGPTFFDSIDDGVGVPNGVKLDYTTFGMQLYASDKMSFTLVEPRQLNGRQIEILQTYFFTRINQAIEVSPALDEFTNTIAYTIKLPTNHATLALLFVQPENIHIQKHQQQRRRRKDRIASTSETTNHSVLSMPGFAKRLRTYVSNADPLLHLVWLIGMVTTWDSPARGVFALTFIHYWTEHDEAITLWHYLWLVAYFVALRVVSYYFM